MAKTDLVVRKVSYDDAGLQQLASIPDEQERTLMIDYPTVYIIDTQNEKSTMLYVGETTNIRNRTMQHLEIDPRDKSEWKKIAQGHDGEMIVIGHNHFNKSMTLDIENQLMLFLSGTETDYKLMNLRTNPQGEYYPKHEKDHIFSQIWRKLHDISPMIFPIEKVVRDSALFKASPFHELTASQSAARKLILERIRTALKNGQRGQLIIVKGEAGSGKTVLLSSLFYELMTTVLETGETYRGNEADAVRMDAKLLVNHDQQVKVYKQIMRKLGIYTDEGEEVGKPTHFINEKSPEDKPFDVVLVDEAHLLYTQGKQSYRGNNQLDDLLSRSRVVVAVMDQHQVLATTGYRRAEEFSRMEQQVNLQGNLVELKAQLRMQAGPAMLDWINSFVFKRVIKPIPERDEKGFDLRIFSSPAEMHAAIKAKAPDQSNGLSRLLATFDWPYVDNRKPEDGSEYWNVTIGDWSMPWNLQRPAESKRQARRNKSLAWAEQPQTIDEVGSTFTIQGLDLNYAGVILGPSVGYRNGKVVSFSDKSASRKATQRRTIDGKRVDVSAELLQNEINVLMTRGVHGLYIYAVDPELRAALRQAALVNVKYVAEDSIKYK